MNLYDTCPVHYEWDKTGESYTYNSMNVVIAGSFYIHVGEIKYESLVKDLLCVFFVCLFFIS